MFLVSERLTFQMRIDKKKLPRDVFVKLLQIAGIISQSVRADVALVAQMFKKLTQVIFEHNGEL